MIGRPKVEWTEREYKQFEGMCAIQCTQQEICDVMGVTDKTLNRLLTENYGMTFSECFKKYGASGKSSLRRYQFDLAKRNAAMAIWLGKQYLGQRDIDLQEQAEARTALRELVEGFGKSME